MPLQAVPEFDGFTGEAAQRLRRLLRPALRPGTPGTRRRRGTPERFSADTEAGDPPSRIWHADTV
ncbi:hypothetical protein ACF9IK_07400 [Kitasatospora hibisci]|uniref:hypothetical protein n=1 Tax=Kitasatospora hibisci TaxID=3369522 RepID=UPI0037546518